MAEGGEGAQYSRLTGLIYIFNLIVGTGALTLPAAFKDAGYLCSTVILILLAFMSFLTATFVIESMAAANALLAWRQAQRQKRSGGERQSSEVIRTTSSQLSSPVRRAFGEQEAEEEERRSQERSPLIQDHEEDGRRGAARRGYEIREITEMGRMASLFFSRGGRNLFYICLVIYLYGDLAIYGAAVAKSVRDVTCTFRPNATVTALNISENAPCWPGSNQSRLSAYRVILALFTCTIGQFVFCNVTKTKYLQMVTTLMRWAAFLIMVALACVALSSSSPASPPPTRFSGLPNLFGVCVYSFMCHHSLPSLVTPIANKSKLYSILLGDYLLILGFYFLLAFTGIFAFTDINDLYTLNFQPSADDSWLLYACHCFLSLFPVFTLSTNFPIIAITLSNNLKALFLTEGRRYSYWTRSFLFPLLALLPPTLVAMATHSLEFLVGLTGSYAGAGIQYVVPAALVYHARQQTTQAIGVGVRNQHRSPFSSIYWVWFVQAWAATCVILVTWNHFSDAFS